MAAARFGPAHRSKPGAHNACSEASNSAAQRGVGRNAVAKAKMHAGARERTQETPGSVVEGLQNSKQKETCIEVGSTWSGRAAPSWNRGSRTKIRCGPAWMIADAHRDPVAREANVRTLFEMQGRRGRRRGLEGWKEWALVWEYHGAFRRILPNRVGNASSTESYSNVAPRPQTALEDVPSNT